MAKAIVVPFEKPKKKRLTNDGKDDIIFRRALAKIRQQSGIDLYAMLRGDEKERRRYRMLQHQAALVPDEDLL